jgi:nitrous oxidase accessory protein
MMLAYWLFAVAAAAELHVGESAPDLQSTVDLAVDGDTVVVPAGRWTGPVVLDRAITLTAEAGGVIVTSGAGHTVRIAAPGAVVDRITVEGSGHEFDGEDACIHIDPTATGAVVQDSAMSACLWGIWVHETHDVKLLGNSVGGLPGVRDADRGNGIHLFDALNVEVRGNTVQHARDGIYVSATEQSVIADNVASNQRFGIHYMYSYDNEISGNITTDNVLGTALMTSFRLKVHHNVAKRNTRQGMLFRDIQYCDVHDNLAEANGEGLFFYSSLDNDIHHNVLRGNQVGARVWAGTERNRVWGNAFVGNRQALFYVSAHDQAWGTPEEGGNYWSDHLAWDQDGDGFTDRPYRADATTATLLYTYPAAVLLLTSPALELLRAMTARLPALRVPSVVDARPLMHPPERP